MELLHQKRKSATHVLYGKGYVGCPGEETNWKILSQIYKTMWLSKVEGHPWLYYKQGKSYLLLNQLAILQTKVLEWFHYICMYTSAILGTDGRFVSLALARVERSGTNTRITTVYFVADFIDLKTLLKTMPPKLLQLMKITLKEKHDSFNTVWTMINKMEYESFWTICIAGLNGKENQGLCR